MQTTAADLCLLIATKDRQVSLNNLLDSISKSSLLPGKVVIVYSGTDISQTVNKYLSHINIEVIYSLIASQVAQKLIGIKSLDLKTDWVLFLDDDVILPMDSLSILVKDYLKNPNFKDVYGFGLKIVNLEFRKLTFKQQFFLRLFDLYSDKSGSVLASGHVQSYQELLNDTETQWLNGISAWKFKTLKDYNTGFSKIDYAAYEDVIFSYRVSKSNRLFFASSVSVINQNIESSSPLKFTQFKAGAYMRYLFVEKNKELSVNMLLIAQLVRNFDFIKNGDTNISILSRFMKSSFIWIDLLLDVITKKDPVNLLLKRYN